MLNALFKQSSLGKVADEYRLHLQMAALETRIRNEPDLHELHASANKAHTDLERRRWFRAYFELYFKKLIALASTPELQAYLRAQQAAHERTLLQPRVRHNPDEAQAADTRENRRPGSRRERAPDSVPSAYGWRAPQSISGRVLRPTRTGDAGRLLRSETATKMNRKNGAFV